MLLVAFVVVAAVAGIYGTWFAAFAVVAVAVFYVSLLLFYFGLQEDVVAQQAFAVVAIAVGALKPLMLFFVVLLFLAAFAQLLTFSIRNNKIRQEK